MWKIAGYALLWLAGSSAAVAVAWAGVAVVDDDIVPAPALARPGGDGSESALDEQPADRQRESTDGANGATIRSAGPNPASDRDGEAMSTESPSSQGAAQTASGLTPGGTPNSEEGSVTTDTAVPAGRSAASSTAAAVATNSSGTTTVERTTGSTTTAATQQSTSRPTTTLSPTTGPATTRSTTTQPATTLPATTPTTPTTTAQTTTAPPPPTTAAQAQTRTFHLVGGSTAISFSAAEVRVLWATPNPGFDVDVGSGGPGVRVEFETDDAESRIDAWWDDGPQQEIRER